MSFLPWKKPAKADVEPPLPTGAPAPEAMASGTGPAAAAAAPTADATSATAAPPTSELPPATKELGDVERNIDLFIGREQGGYGIRQRFKEKYGEDLALPSAVDSYRYEYLEPDLVEAVVVGPDKDIEVGDFTFAKPGDAKAADAAAGQPAPTGDVAAAAPAPKAAAASARPAAAKAGPRKAPSLGGLFGGGAKAETAKAKSAVKELTAKPQQDEPVWGFREEEFLTGFEKVKKGIPCLLFDWTCLPYFKYARARGAYRNTLVKYLVIDLALLIVPVFIPLIVKLLTGWSMPLARMARRRTGQKEVIADAKRRRAQKEAAAAAAAKAAAAAAAPPAKPAGVAVAAAATGAAAGAPTASTARP